MTCPGSRSISTASRVKSVVSRLDANQEGKGFGSRAEKLAMSRTPSSVLCVTNNKKFGKLFLSSIKCATIYMVVMVGTNVDTLFGGFS